MKHIILTGYHVGVINVPPDNGGGRVVQLAAKDGSELIEIALDDETWDGFVRMGSRIKIVSPDGAA